MILFYDDWGRHPGATIHHQTTNTSFVRLTGLYKTMGVRNHAFPLAIHNRDLIGIDPHSEFLTMEEMGMIALECQENPWYYFREVARAPGRSTPDPVSFKANRGNIALFWLFFNHVTTILIQIRQTGKSFSTDSLMVYLLNIGVNNVQINLLTKDETLRSFNLERMKDIQSLLPYYLNQKRKDDIANTEELSIKELSNTYKSHLPNKSTKMALNVGRGLTSPIFHIDEAAYIANIGISLPAALAAGTAARDFAKITGNHYGTILTTTSGKKDDRDGRYVYNLASDSAIWTELLLDCRDQEDLYKTIRTNAPRGEVRVNCTLNHRQLGYTDEWLKQALEDAMVSKEDADRDFFNIWTSGTQTSPLPIAMLQDIRESQVLDPTVVISPPYGYLTRWYVNEGSIPQRMANTDTVLSLDTSDAAGGDDIGLVLKDIRSGETLAAGNYNETNLITFAEWLVIWLVTYPKLTMIIERRSTGSMIIDYLILLLVSKGIDPFKRLYNRVVQDADEFKDRYKEIQKPMHARPNDIYIRYKKQFGFATSALGSTSRTELYSTTLLTSAKYTGNKVKDVKIIDQLLSLEMRNGRVDHPEGGKDDMVIAWLLGNYFMFNGKHLEFYGIDSRNILISDRHSFSAVDSVAAYNQQEQVALENKIEELIERLKHCKDQFIIQKLENELRFYANQLNEDNRLRLSYDELIMDLRKRRIMASRIGYFTH